MYTKSRFHLTNRYRFIKYYCLALFSKYGGTKRCPSLKGILSLLSALTMPADRSTTSVDNTNLTNSSYPRSNLETLLHSRQWGIHVFFLFFLFLRKQIYIINFRLAVKRLEICFPLWPTGQRSISLRASIFWSVIFVPFTPMLLWFMCKKQFTIYKKLQLCNSISLAFLSAFFPAHAHEQPFVSRAFFWMRDCPLKAIDFAFQLLKNNWFFFSFVTIGSIITHRT